MFGFGKNKTNEEIKDEISRLRSEKKQFAQKNAAIDERSRLKAQLKAEKRAVKNERFKSSAVGRGVGAARKFARSPAVDKVFTGLSKAGGAVLKAGENYNKNMAKKSKNDPLDGFKW